MQWHDPLRPQLGNGRPCLTANGKPLSALPYVTLCPRPSGQIELMANLPRRPGEFQYYSILTSPEALPELFAQLMADPEETFRMWGWNYRDELPTAKSLPKPKTPTLTLEDLDL